MTIKIIINNYIINTENNVAVPVVIIIVTVVPVVVLVVLVVHVVAVLLAETIAASLTPFSLAFLRIYIFL